MSTYDLDELLRLWEFEKISEQQAIGQLIVHLRQVHERMKVLERDGLQPMVKSSIDDGVDRHRS